MIEDTRLRQRAKKPKVRTGCRTCKLRRVKCDEDRPECQRCKSSGRICAGYEINPSGQRTVSPQAVAIAPKVKPELIIQPTSSLGLSNEEAANFDYFRTKTMLSIGGFSRYSLWESLIIQFSFREPAVLNAAVAVGSMHRSFERFRWPEAVPDDLALQKRLSQKHYLKAINSLRTKLGDDSDPRKHEVALMTCFLFICLELIQSDISSAVNHLRTGLRILCELKGQSAYKKGESVVVSASSHPESLLDFLTIFFARLDYQSTMFGEKIPRTLAMSSSNTSGSVLWIPQTFSSITEARQYLDTVSSAVFAFRGRIVHDLAYPNSWLSKDKSLKHRWAHIMYKHPDVKALDPKFPAQQNELEERMLIWERIFQKLVSKNQRFFSQEEARSSKLAHNNWLAIWILLKEALSTRQKFFDQYTEEFRQIVALSEEFCMTKETTLPSFSTDMGCFGALYYVATKCRDSEIRRKAASLLLRSPRREGMWDGHVISQFARQVIAIEESGLLPKGAYLTCDEVPESARFSDITIGFSKDGSRGRLYLGRFRHESDGQWFVQELEFEFMRDPMIVKTLEITPKPDISDTVNLGPATFEIPLGIWASQPPSPTAGFKNNHTHRGLPFLPKFTLPDETELELLKRQHDSQARGCNKNEPETPLPQDDGAFTPSSEPLAVWPEITSQEYQSFHDYDGEPEFMGQIDPALSSEVPLFEPGGNSVMNFIRSG